MLPVILENVPQFEFLGCFLINRLRLCIFDKKQYRNDAAPFSALHIWGVQIICLLAGDVNFDHCGYGAVSLVSLMINTFLRTRRLFPSLHYKIWRTLDWVIQENRGTSFWLKRVIITWLKSLVTIHDLFLPQTEWNGEWCSLSG